MLRRALKRGVVLDCIHGSSTRWRCSTSGLVHSLTDSQSLKNMFQIVPMEGPRMRGVQLVDWCICGSTCRALKRRSRSALFCFFSTKNYQCFYLHRSIDFVSPVIGIFKKICVLDFVVFLYIFFWIILTFLFTFVSDFLKIFWTF